MILIPTHLQHFGTFKHGIGSRGFQIFSTREWMVQLEDVNGEREPQGGLAVIERKRWQEIVAPRFAHADLYQFI